MSSTTREDNTGIADNPSAHAQPSAPTEVRPGGWTVISKPGAAVEISTRPMPEHIRIAIARNLGIGTGTPREH